MNRSMDVGLEGVLLTRHLYSLPSRMVPYSGDEEFCLFWCDGAHSTAV